MTMFPYPIRPSRVEIVLTVLMWTAGIAVAPYILTFPPVSYEGLGLVASIGWGVLAGVGSLLVLLGRIKHTPEIEAPGLLLFLTGVGVYVGLSWEQAINTSPGSGARGLLILMLLCTALIRLNKLRLHRKDMKRIEKIGRG